MACNNTWSPGLVTRSTGVCILGSIVQPQEVKLDQICLKSNSFWQTQYSFFSLKTKSGEDTVKTNDWTTEQSGRKEKQNIVNLQTVLVQYVWETV